MYMILLTEMRCGIVILFYNMVIFLFPNPRSQIFYLNSSDAITVKKIVFSDLVQLIIKIHVISSSFENSLPSNASKLNIFPFNQFPFFSCGKKKEKQKKRIQSVYFYQCKCDQYLYSCVFLSVEMCFSLGIQHACEMSIDFGEGNLWVQISV